MTILPEVATPIEEEKCRPAASTSVPNNKALSASQEEMQAKRERENINHKQKIPTENGG